MGKLKITYTKGTQEDDFIHLKKTAAGNMIKFRLSRYKFTDKDTLQLVYFVPSLDLSGYGSTPEKAEEMMTGAIDAYFTYMNSLSAKDIKRELASLGWKQNQFKSKDYSMSYVDYEGNLQGLNAVDDRIEVEALVN